MKFRPCLALLLATSAIFLNEGKTEEVIAEMEPIEVEGTFVDSLERKQEAAIREAIARITLREETTRALELQEANQSELTKLLDLTRYIPIPLGAVDGRADSFFFTRSYPHPESDRTAEKLFAP